MRLDAILNDRTTSSFGLSIGTALAIESIFGTDNNVYDKTREVIPIHINDYKYYYINIYTMLRNIYTAVPSKELGILLDNTGHKKIILNVLYQEIEILNNLFNNMKCEIVYFLPDYSKVTKRVFLRSNRKISRKEQIYINSLSLVSEISKELEDMNVHMLEDTYKLDADTNKILITTHIAPDLLNTSYVKHLYLLESHTGKLKTKLEFNSKYPKSKVIDTTRLPFNEILLRLLGDNFILDDPIVNFKREIEAIANDRNWNPTTTETKVIANLKSNVDIRDQINVILSYNKTYR